MYVTVNQRRCRCTHTTESTASQLWQSKLSLLRKNFNIQYESNTNQSYSTNIYYKNCVF